MIGYADEKSRLFNFYTSFMALTSMLTKEKQPLCVEVILPISNNNSEYFFH